VNALASWLGRSRFAACVRRFATRGCVRGGLAGLASGEVPPALWPTVAGVLADCLFVHRAGSWSKRPLVQSPGGRNTETRERQRTSRIRRAARTMSPAENVESSVAALSKRPVNGLPARSLHPTLGADRIVRDPTSRIATVGTLVARAADSAARPTKRACQTSRN
jgi:hypothetical protein